MYLEVYVYIHTYKYIYMYVTTIIEERSHEFERVRRDIWEDLEGEREGEMM